MAVKAEYKLIELRYPFLMKSETGEIVFFVSDKCGFQLNETETFQQGYSDDWIMSDFKPFPGTITLSNE